MRLTYTDPAFAHLGVAMPGVPIVLSDEEMVIVEGRSAGSGNHGRADRSPTMLGLTMPPVRQRDADRTRTEILEVATSEFAERGYSGARVDEIAARTRTTKRMIYYYFGGKEQLYIAVLERAYAQIRDAESTLDVDQLDPLAAIRELAELTFDHHERHPEFLRLVAIENIHRAEHIARSTVLAGMNTRVVELISRILTRGQDQGVFRREVDPLDLHMLISAFCVFRVANRHTFKAIFGRDLAERARRAHYRRMLSDVVVAYLTTLPPADLKPGLAKASGRA